MADGFMSDMAYVWWTGLDWTFVWSVLDWNIFFRNTIFVICGVVSGAVYECECCAEMVCSGERGWIQL